MIIASSFHPTTGGAETYAYVTAQGFADRGHQVMVVTDALNAEAAGRTMPGDPRGVTVRRLFRYRGLLADPSKVFWEQMAFSLTAEFAECAEEFRPDLVFTNTLDMAMAGRMIALDRDIPWVATFHEHEPESQPLGGARLRVVHEFLRPTLVLACAENYADRARRNGSVEATTLIHHGVDTAVFRPDRDVAGLRKDYGYVPADCVILCPAQLKPRKGVRELIQAFHAVHTRRPDTRLLVAGAVSSSSGDYPEQLRADVDRLGLSATVRFETAVTFDLMPDLMAAADIVALPSSGEGFSLAMLEAMSSGRPLLVTDFPGVRELVGGPDTAVLARSADPGHLVGPLLRMASDASLRRRIGASARRYITARFTLDRMIDRTESAILSVLGGASKA